MLLLPNYSEVTPQDVSLRTTLCGKISLDIPVLSSPMDTVTESRMLIALGRLGGLGIIHKNLSIDEQAAQLKEALDAGVQAAAAVGVGSDFELRVETLAKLHPTAICIDSAHGHTKNILQCTRHIKERHPSIPLIVGNVVTYEGASALFEVGADSVKVGVGPGSICTTRIMSGVGMPQLSAIFECSKAAKEYGRTIIADGGIRHGGDIVKALAAGASAVMMGSILAGTEESAGELIEIDGKQYKTYRGMGSLKSMARGSATRYGQSSQPRTSQKLVPEGVEGFIPYAGSVENVLFQLLGGLRAGCGYLGASTIELLQQKARFISISTAAVKESHPHTILLK